MYYSKSTASIKLCQPPVQVNVKFPCAELCTTSEDVPRWSKAPLIPNLGIRWKWVVSLILQSLYRLEWAAGFFGLYGSCGGEEISALIGNPTRYSGRLTDSFSSTEWAILRSKTAAVFSYCGPNRGAVGQAVRFLTFIHNFRFRNSTKTLIFLAVWVVFLFSHSNIWIYLKFCYLHISFLTINQLHSWINESLDK